MIIITKPTLFLKGLKGSLVHVFVQGASIWQYHISHREFQPFLTVYGSSMKEIRKCQSHIRIIM